MRYTVSQLAALAGVSPRTLRHYDNIGLLCPTRDDDSGYRRYGSAEVDRLQQILFYRELGLELSRIAAILDDPAFDARQALRAHIDELAARRRRLDGLIETAEQTLKALKGENDMNDQAKFEAFKKKLVEDNEQKYGAEVREKYGDAEVDASNARMMKMTEAQYAAFKALGEELNETLRLAVQAGDPAGEAAQKAAALHKDWLCFTWPQYSAEAHRGLTEMYVDDARFTAYYDAIAPGAAALLRDAVAIYTQGNRA